MKRRNSSLHFAFGRSTRFQVGRAKYVEWLTNEQTAKRNHLLVTSSRYDLGTIHLRIQYGGGRFFPEKKEEKVARPSETTLIFINRKRLHAHNAKMSTPYYKLSNNLNLHCYLVGCEAVQSDRNFRHLEEMCCFCLQDRIVSQASKP